MMKDLLEEKLQEIDLVLKREYANEEHVGALVGLSGIALFQFYHSKYKNTNDHSVIGIEILEIIMDKINQGYNHSTFCNGISGASWVLCHLEEKGFIDIDNDQLLTGFDDFLYSTMIADMQKKTYDFLHGGVGHALYFLNRYRNTKTTELKEKYKLYLMEFIDLLRLNSENEGDNVLKWVSVQARGEVNYKYDFSLSHGITSIIGILTKLYEYDDFRDLVKPMLTGAINYLIAHKKKNGSFFLFPNMILKNGEESSPSRLAWCYGDLGIGIRLWFASKALKDRVLADEALAILKHSVNRRTPEETLIKDASLCHGSYGVALIFMRIYKETLDPVFKEAVEYWMQDGIGKAIHDNGYAGYRQWKFDDSWVSDVSLLEGVSGIGLAIIGYLADFDTSWDECLMIS